MRRLTIASLAVHRQRRSVAVTSAPRSPVPTIRPGPQPASNTLANQCLSGHASSASALLLQRGVLFILRCGPAKRRRNSRAYSPAPCSTSSRRSISRFMRLGVNVKRRRACRQAPSAGESPSPSILLTQRLRRAMHGCAIASRLTAGWRYGHSVA